MATGWGPPLIDFGIIGNLGEDYQKGQEYARQNALRQQFQGGLPRTPTGEVDWNAVMQMVAKTGNLGNIQSIAAMLPFSHEMGTRAATGTFQKALSGFGGSEGGGAAPPAPSTIGSPVNPFGMVPGGTEGYVNPGFRAQAAPMPTQATAQPVGGDPGYPPNMIGPDEGRRLGIYDDEPSAQPTRLAYAPTTQRSMTDVPMVGVAPGMQFAQAGGGGTAGVPGIPTGQGQITGGVQPGATPVTTTPYRPPPQRPAGPSTRPTTPPTDISRIVNLANALANPRLPAHQLAVGKTILEHELKKTDLPNDVKEYLATLKIPGLKEYMLEMKRAGATSVNTAEGAEAIATRERYQADRPMVQEAIKEGTEALKRAPIIDRLFELAGSTPPGLLGTIAGKLNPLLSAAGITWEGGDHASLFGALGRQLIPAIRMSGEGAVSNFEQQMYIDAVPALSQSPQGRRLLAEMLKGQMLRSVEAAKIAREYHGKPELFSKLQDIDRNPTMDNRMRLGVVNELLRSRGEAPVGGDIKVVFTPAERDKLAPNTDYIMYGDPALEIRTYRGRK